MLIVQAYNIHTMQFIMENYDLVIYNVPKNPKPIDSPTQYFNHILRDDQSTSEPNLIKIKGSRLVKEG